MCSNHSGQSKPRKRDCQMCENAKAVGKYYVDPSESENHGWWRVCSFCAQTVERVGAVVEYYVYSKEYRERLNPKPTLPPEVLSCSHDWVKWSLVGEVDKNRDALFDWVKCTHCKCYGKRFSIGQTIMDDLTMEIDLNCSR